VIKTCALIFSIILPTIALAQQSDITFIVAGKTSNHRQQVDGTIKTLNFHFFAEIFLQSDGEATLANISTPLTNNPIDFSDSGYALEMHGGRYKTEQELESNYPDGNYRFQYAAPSIGSVSHSIVMTKTRTSGSSLPEAPKIELSQGGLPVAPDQIDPNLDLKVTWSEFTEGGQDPLGIMDDLLFVIMANCHGERIAHSGRPFENRPYLTYADHSFLIDAEILIPENAYQLSVEHAILDTSINYGVPAFATFATTTFLDLKTTGFAEGDAGCPRVLQIFDAGQTVLP
jgi:hypothetical protein